MADFDAGQAARFIADAHRARATFENLQGDLTPPSIADAYAAQEALVDIWQADYGPVAGLKIATTTKVMQELMGIDHPCGGMIYQNRIHSSPTTLKASDYTHVVIECELAVVLKADLAGQASSYSAADVRTAVGEAMAVFELIEDHNAVYTDCDVRTLIADNSWNAGIVAGERIAVPDGLELNGLAGKLLVNGDVRSEGPTDGPMDALAWVANHAVERGRPLRKDMFVITGSVVATLPILPGENFRFELDKIGSCEVTLAA
ncbi:MAG: fumarylacetoacetate hydrolase family protein [Pseudomonadota bacterium]